MISANLFIFLVCVKLFVVVSCAVFRSHSSVLPRISTAAARLIRVIVVFDLGGLCCCPIFIAIAFKHPTALYQRDYWQPLIWVVVFSTMSAYTAKPRARLDSGPA